MAANNSSTGDLLSSESGFRYCRVVRYILFSSLIFCFIFDVGCSDFKKYIVSINYRLLYFCGKYQYCSCIASWFGGIGDCSYKEIRVNLILIGNDCCLRYQN